MSTTTCRKDATTRTAGCTNRTGPFTSRLPGALPAAENGTRTVGCTNTTTGIHIDAK